MTPVQVFSLTTILFLQLSDSSERRINQTIRTKDEMEEAQCSSHYLGNTRTKENGLQARRAPCPVHSLGLGLIISNMPRGTGDKKKRCSVKFSVTQSCCSSQASMENDDHFIPSLSALLMPFKRIRVYLYLRTFSNSELCQCG